MTAPALQAFVDDIGASGPVVAVGGRTQFDIGGAPSPHTREVEAPAGIVEHDPAEMVVRVRAGTTVAALEHALAEHGQETVLWSDRPAEATVGGILAVGRSGPRRLRVGPVRDAVLEATFVTASGELAKAGGPVVKNVTGFDVCRLLVGSLGTLALLGEVVLRCLPVPPARRWLTAAGVDPLDTLHRLHRPTAVLWDGEATWVLLEGHPADVEAQTGVLGREWAVTDGPPPLPPHPWSVDPADLQDLGSAAEPFVAEIGVGTVHRDRAQPARAVPAPVRALNHRIKDLFDPTGRLAPGRSVL